MNPVGGLGVAMAALLLLQLGCSRQPLERGVRVGRQTTRSIEDVPVRGFPAEVTYLVAGKECEVSGELLAVSDVLWLEQDGRTVGVPLSLVQSVRISVFPSGATGLGIWTAVGTASTLSHGLLLIYTAPMWLAAGIPSTALASRSSHTEASAAGSFHELNEYARFPAGLPRRWPAGELVALGSSRPAR